MDEIDAPGPGFRPDQLEGFRIGVTSDRRSEDLIAAFERRGAEVLHAPTIKMVGAPDDGHLERETRAVIAARPSILLATTSYGLRRWFEQADAAGLGPDLVSVLSAARVLVRGPKARGAVRAAGLDDSGMSERETTESLVDMVLASGSVAGTTIAVQLHGDSELSVLDRLSDAGARVLTVRPYMWQEHEDQTRISRLVTAAVSGGLDAVTFTSAPAAEALLRAAEREGRLDALLGAFGASRALGAFDGFGADAAGWAPSAGAGPFGGGAASAALPVIAAVVGPVTAEPLLERGIAPVVPERFRMGALIKLTCDVLEQQRVLRLDTAFGEVLLRGRVAEVAGARVGLSPVSLALFRRLVGASGGIVPRDALAVAAPEPLDGASLDMAISRLRRALPEPRLIETVTKRGYRVPVA